MMIKVLFIGMTPNPGGLETYMMNIFSKLQGHGFQFYFVNTYIKPIAYSKFIKQNNGIIYNIPMKRNIIRYLIRYHVVKNFFKYHHNFDIVHVNALAVNEYYWVNAAKKYGEKHIIFQSHESSNIRKVGLIPLMKWILSIYNKYLLCHNNVIKLAASNDCGKWMFGNKSKFKVIYNGIDTNYFKPNLYLRNILRKRLGINHDNVIITTARLHKQKNYPKIVRVFRQVNNINPDTKLVIIGQGHEMSHIKDMVRQFKLNDQVIFMGLQSKKNISKLLNVGDLMIMPSFFEGLPFSLIEAESVGLSALVSLNIIPKVANITGSVTYLPLSYSDKLWAKRALLILKKSYNFNARLKRNNKLAKSEFNINKSIERIKNIYLEAEGINL